MLQTGLLGYCKIHGFWILYHSKTAGGEGRTGMVSNGKCIHHNKETSISPTGKTVSY